MASYYFRTSHSTDPSMRAVRDFRGLKRGRFCGRVFYSRHFCKVVGLTASSRMRIFLDCYSIHFLKSRQFDRNARLESPMNRE